MYELFKMFGSVDVKNEKANKGIDETVEKASKGEKSMNSSFASIGKGAKKLAIGIAGVTAGVAALGVGVVALTNKITGMNDEISKTSQKVGVTTDELQKMRFAAQRNGVSTTTMEMSLKKLNSQLSLTGEESKTSTKAITDLGIAITDVNGEQRSAADIFQDVLYATDEMATSQEKLATITNIFGERYASEFLPIINAGGDSFKELTDRAEDLGLVISGDTLKASEAWQDSWLEITSILKALSSEVLGVFLPALQIVIEKSVEFTSKIKKGFMEIEPVMRQVIGNSLIFVGKFLQGLALFVNYITNAFPKVNAELSETITMLENMLNEFWKTTVSVSAKIWIALTEIWEKLEPYIVPILDTLVAGFITSLQGIIDFSTTLYKMIDKIFSGDIKGAIQDFIDFLERDFTRWEEFLQPILDYIVNFSKEVVDKFKELGKNIVEGLKNGISNSIDVATKSITSLADKVVGTFKDKLDIHSPSRIFTWFGEMIGDGLNNGVASKINETGQTIEKWGQDIINGGKDAVEGLNNELAEIANNEALSETAKNVAAMGAYFKAFSTNLSSDISQSIAEITVAIANGTGSWRDLLTSFSGIFNKIMTDMIAHWIKGLLTSEAVQNSWLVTTLKTMAKAAASFISTAYAGLVAFFTFLGPFAPVAAAGVIATAIGALVKLGAKVGSKISGGGGGGSPSGATAPTTGKTSSTGTSTGYQSGGSDLVKLLSPLANFNNLIEINRSILDTLKTGVVLSGSNALGVAGVGSSINIGEININSTAENGQQLTEEFLDVLEVQLADRQTLNRRRI